MVESLDFRWQSSGLKCSETFEMTSNYPRQSSETLESSTENAENISVGLNTIVYLFGKNIGLR